MAINTISNDNLPSNSAFLDEYSKPGFKPGVIYEAATNATTSESVFGNAGSATPFTLEDTFTDTSGTVTTTYYSVTPDPNTFNYTTVLGSLGNGDHTLQTSTAQGATTAAQFNGGTVSAPYDVLVSHAPGNTVTPALVATITDAHDTAGTDNNTASAGLTFSGTADSFSIIRVYVGGTASGGGTQIADAVQTDASGHWSVMENPSFIGALPAGTNFYQVTSTDIAGNSNAGMTHSFNVDTQAPTITTNAVSYTDTSVGHMATYNGVVSLTGTVTDNVTVDNVEVYAVTGTGPNAVTTDIGAATVTGGSSGSAGAWTLNNVTLTGDGQKTFFALAVDEAGNVSGQAASPTSFLLDTQAPTAGTPTVSYTETGLGTPAGSHTTNINSVTLSSTDTDTSGGLGVSTVQVYDTFNGTTTLVGAATAGPSNSYSFVDGNLANGTHSLTEVVTDVAGNRSTLTTPFVVTVDNVAPVVQSDTQTYTSTVGTHNAGDSVSGLTNDPYITVTVATTDTGGTGVNNVEVFDDQTATNGGDVFVGTATLNNSGQYVFNTSTLSQGVHHLYVQVEDNASNLTDTGDLPAFTLDTITPHRPTLVIVDTGSQQTTPVTSNDTLSGVAEPGSSVRVLVDGATYTTTANATTGAYSVTPTSLSQGSHFASVQAIDAAGNASDFTGGGFVYDTVSPTVAVAETTPGQQVNATNSSVSITITLSDPALNLDGSAHTVTASDFTVTGGALSNIAQSQGNPNVYTATFTNTATGNSVNDSVTFNSGVIFDQAGNPNTAGSTTVHGDTQPPAAPVITNVDGSPVNAEAPTTQQVIISGTSEANSTVNIYDVVQNDFAGYNRAAASSAPSSQVLVGATTTDANGHYSLTAYALTSDVTHVFTATASDAAGNVSGVSNSVAGAVLSPADTYGAKAVIPSITSGVATTVSDYFVVGSAAESQYTTSPQSDADLINAGRTHTEVINAEYDVNSTITVGASAITVINGGEGANITAGSGINDFIIDLLAPASAQNGVQGYPLSTSRVSASPLADAQSIHQFATGDTLDVSSVFGAGSTLQVANVSGGQIVTVTNDLSGGTTEVKIDGAPISASQIITRITQAYDPTDAGQIVSTYTGGSSTPSTVAGYDATGNHLFTNLYDSSGRVIEQDGYSPTTGAEVLRILDNADGSRLFYNYASNGVLSTLVGFDAGGHETFLNTYNSAGGLVEQDGFNSAGVETIRINTASDGSRGIANFSSTGVITTSSGYDASGHETYFNTYNSTGGIVEQDGFNSAGIETIRINTASDGSRGIANFSSTGVITTSSGYDASGHETYFNTYNASGGIVEQDGFNSAGVKTIEIDHLTSGNVLNASFDNNGSLTAQTLFDSNQNVLSMLTRNPGTGAYTNTGEVDGVTLSTFTGTGELVANGASTTIALTSGFGTAAVDDFLAGNSQGHDMVHVLTNQAANYNQLLADAHDSGNDLVITFDANDVLTIHGVHTAQLSSSDFLFG